MARPIIKSIEYYPMNCNFLNDIKIRRIMKACGASSIAVLLHLLGNIYGDEGYYMVWNEDVAFLTADFIGVKEGQVTEVINKALQVGFFDSDKFEQFGILTSKGIQSRYFKATEKRKNDHVVFKYLIVDSGVNGVNDTETAVIEEETPVNVSASTQSKVKESKVKESKGEYSEVGSCIRKLLSLPDDIPLLFLESLNQTETEKIYSELERSSWLRENLDPNHRLSEGFKKSILNGKYRDFPNKKKPKQRHENISNSRTSKYSDKELDDMAKRKRTEHLSAIGASHD